MKVDDLRFDTPDNACLSLRIIAEKIRSGDLQIIDGTFCETSARGAWHSMDLKVSVVARR